MNNDELMAYSQEIFDLVFCSENTDKSNDEILQLIKSVVMEIELRGRKIGRRQIINHFQCEIDAIK